MQHTAYFSEAMRDYICLLEKKYPEKSVLEMVATRYSLNHYERSMLYRGIMSQEIADGRKSRIITIEQLNNRTLHIDLFNVLFTIAAYLRGFPVYFSRDGLLRDASESHGSGEWETHLAGGMDLVFRHLPALDCQKVTFYRDNLLLSIHEIPEKLRELAAENPASIEIIADASPDHLIREATEGIIATSDSTIIDKSTLPVFDLPAFIIRKSFHKEIFSLADQPSINR